MEVGFFFKERTKIIKFYYDTASRPFIEIKRKIETHEYPYCPPHDYENEEPPFLDEWIDANTSLQILASSCVSMLSASLKLYFQTWENDLGIKCDNRERKAAFKNGFLEGYRVCFEETLGVRFSDCASDLSILGDAVLIRNTDQHPNSIFSLAAEYPKDKWIMNRDKFSLSESERNILSNVSDDLIWNLSSVPIDDRILFRLIDEANNLVTWLDDKIFKFKYSR